jgi:hypothetical protein
MRQHVGPIGKHPIAVFTLNPGCGGLFVGQCVLGVVGFQAKFGLANGADELVAGFVMPQRVFVQLGTRRKRVFALGTLVFWSC